MNEEEETEELLENWTKVDPARFRAWKKTYYTPSAESERKRLGFPSNQISPRTTQEAIVDFSKYIGVWPSPPENDPVYESALKSIGKQVSEWVEMGKHEEISKLAKIVKSGRLSEKERNTARKEILRIFHQFFKLRILPTEDQIEARMRLWENAPRADSYYKKGKFIEDLESVGLGGLRTRKKGRPKKEVEKNSP